MVNQFVSFWPFALSRQTHMYQARIFIGKYECANLLGRLFGGLFGDLLYHSERSSRLLVA